MTCLTGSLSAGLLMEFNEKGGMDVNGVAIHIGNGLSTPVSFSVDKPKF